MHGKGVEILAAAVSIGAIAGSTVVPLSIGGHRLPDGVGAGTPVITITGVAATGTWTDEEVTGANYWYKDFEAARPVLREGALCILRLKSADVVHGFYSPMLGIGPIEVYPGHVVEVTIRPERKGTFPYYCTTFCGDPHFGMQGEILVLGEGDPVPVKRSGPVDRYWLLQRPSRDTDITERGKWLYRQKGCFTCHGREGKGGVSNWNFAGGTVPTLNNLAERIELYEPEEVEAVLRLFRKGKSFEDVEELPPLESFEGTRAQYRRVRDLILNGKTASKRDLKGAAPPLDMPAWKEILSADDIDAILAYLLTLQPWEDDEDEEDREESRKERK